MQNLRNLAWRLSWYRQSELEGALLLGRMVRQASDPYLIARLTRHCADEARHAWLWERTLARLDLVAVRIFRSYQSLYLDHAGAPASLEDVLAMTHVFEHRVHHRFAEELRQPGLPEPARRTFSTLLRDEQGHLDWVGKWLGARPGAASALRRYRDADERVYRQLAPYGERVWDIPGLGEELTGERHDDRTEEPHEAKSEHRS